MAQAPPNSLYTFHGGMSGVMCILYLDREDALSTIYCGTESGDVVLWGCQEMRQLNVIKVGEDACVSIAFHNYFITQEKGGDIAFWRESLYRWDKVKSFPCKVSSFCSISVVGSLLVHPYSENQVKFIRLNDISCGYDVLKSEGTVSQSDKSLGMIMSAKYSREKKKLLLCFENGSVCSINPDSGRIENRIKFNSGCPMCLDYCDVRNFGIVGFSSKDIIKFSWNEAGDFVMGGKTELSNPGSSSVSIREDGALFVCGTWNGDIKYFSSKSLKLLAVLNEHALSVGCLKFVRKFSEERDAKKKAECLLAGSRDGRMSLWDLYAS